MSFNRSSFAEIQKKAGNVGKIRTLDDIKEREYTLMEAVEECKDFISKTMPKNLRFIRNDEKKLKDETIRYIVKYVDTKKPAVKDIDSFKELKQELIREITEFGIITELIDDPEVDEIQINSMDQIFYEQGGRRYLYDKVFDDRDHFQRIIDKLINDSRGRLTLITPFINAKTYHGYRVNAIHPNISGKDDYAAVVRKFKVVRMSAREFIENKSFTRNMYELIRLIPKGKLSWITAGETGSGKTTLNELMAKIIPPDQRIITIENPPEYQLTKEGPDGRPLNNVLSLVAESKSDAKDTDPTMENLIVNALRQSPEWIAPGELRSAEEFRVALIAAQTGHKFFTTMHAGSGEDVIDRFLTAYCSVSNEPPQLALRNICKSINMILCQERLNDGTRKVTGIYEVVGAEDLKPILNPIYKFVINDNIENPDGSITIDGHHIRVGKLTEELQERFLMAGIPKKYFDKFTKDPSPDEVDSYDSTGIS